MDDYEPWLTPCDPDFDPEKCESAYALWAVKEEGEPVKFLEASITDNLDYPSGYWFFWRTISVRPVAAATSAAASDLSASNSSSASVQWRYPAASTIAAPILV